MNPFTLKDYAGPEYFCNRKSETEKIVNAAQNQRNLTLSSIRKMGKTGLIHHVFHQLSEINEMDTVYFDIYHTESLSGFINKLGTSLLAEKESWPEKVKRMTKYFIRHIRPTITFDGLTGLPALSFNIENESSGIRTLEDIFGFLAERSNEKPMIVAIDEFQQIVNYPENNIEALLRVNIQKLQNVSFIFSGSDKQLLASMFTDAKKPFYQSTEWMYLEEIPQDDYSIFIKEKFTSGFILIDDEAVKEILRQTHSHTYYVQFLCNKLYGSDIKEITVETVKQTLSDILEENDVYYSEYRNLLTKQQWNLLLALAREEGISQVTSSSFIHKHNLSNAATIRRGIKSLMDKNMIYKKGIKYYVYDVFFAKWLKRL
ncbi:MAG: ATP-binding protein [Bacteroidetes bacterium]|nr:MAG: ATP-binding protein [Bacteroidota bacterium]RLD47988.1 MAG: ATP-binding protein [Bacteroidota bacterium]RLD68713.1 MAG: ATP-binding protein [Bacteroidota bacterium]RLD88190.1 MAG: ATP-binding protein [Bacteroidota bacterium]